jgi:hypothetical protein
MIATSHKSKSAHTHARKQQIEFRIKELNLQLIRLIAERKDLVEERSRLDLTEPPLVIDIPAFIPEVVRTCSSVVMRKGGPRPKPAQPEAPPQVEEVYGPPRPPGRRTIFTPEVLAQIPNWVEHGLSREEIAKRIGCKLSSLQVTCCRQGISLRRDPATFVRRYRTKEAAHEEG